jgi:hypothetical protein
MTLHPCCNGRWPDRGGHGDGDGDCVKTVMRERRMDEVKSIKQYN